ncbi:MAG: dihydrodipicolinate reductase C-terminal domain-containing protein [Bdellovibrionia bacterium]
MIKIGLLGARGRMGQSISRLLATEFATVATLSAAVNRGDSLDPLLQTDVVIDFSSPASFLTLAEKILSNAKGVPPHLPAFVVGSTGWNAADEKTLIELGSRAPVLIASNFSTGVSALARILQQASPLLEKLGYTPVIVETHHEHKVDAPSGTAISLQKAIRPSKPGTIQTHSIRAGEVIGDHEVTFYGKNDQITISHFAQNRSIFAHGAIQAALWLAQNRSMRSPQGLLSMENYFHALTERNPTHE